MVKGLKKRNVRKRSNTRGNKNKITNNVRGRGI